MAVLTRNKLNVFGLVDDLATLQTNIDNEETRAIGVEGILNNLTTTDKTNLVSAINELKTLNTNLSIDLTNESTARTDADSDLSDRLDIVESNAIAGVVWKQSYDTLSALETALTSVEGSTLVGWAYYVKATNDGYIVVDENDGDFVPSGWTTKSLVKFADYNELSQLFADEAQARIDGDALALKKASNLSDLADNAISRTNLDVYSKSEVDSAINAGGAIFYTETLTVASDKITLSHSPKNGVIFNFATVRHVDSNFVSYDIPVTVTATPGGKEFLLAPDASGQFDGKTVSIQYAYIA